MIRVVTTALLLCAFLACGDAPRRKGSELYVVKSTVADPSRGAITIVISVDSPSEADVKAAAEEVIAKHKTQYPSIIVKSHLGSADPAGLPYGTSVLEGGVITHSINRQYAPEKIGTH